MRSTVRQFALVVAGLAVLVIPGPGVVGRAATSAGTQSAPPAFQGEAAEQFLLRARVGRVEELGEGVTRPKRVTLELDGLTHDAVFKFIDERRQGVTEFPDGTVDVNFRDSWETEVAAYLVDRMIGLGMVPATVEREVQGTPGSLQWWLDGVISEADRVEQGRRPTDPEDWSHQQFKIFLFDELIANVDRHLDNLLITEDFQVRLIDHSRSFRDRGSLQRPERLTRFSRSLLDGIERLTFEDLKRAIGRHVSDSNIEQLLRRRDAILALAHQLVEERGEGAVIYR